MAEPALVVLHYFRDPRIAASLKPEGPPPHPTGCRDFRDPRIAASLKLAVLANSTRRHHHFRDPRIAASLKQRSSPDHFRRTPDFRDPRIAASLKLDGGLGGERSLRISAILGSRPH